MLCILIEIESVNFLKKIDSDLINFIFGFMNDFAH